MTYRLPFVVLSEVSQNSRLCLSCLLLKDCFGGHRSVIESVARKTNGPIGNFSLEESRVAGCVKTATHTMRAPWGFKIPAHYIICQGVASDCHGTAWKKQTVKYLSKSLNGAWWWRFLCVLKTSHLLGQWEQRKHKWWVSSSVTVFCSQYKVSLLSAAIFERNGPLFYSFSYLRCCFVHECWSSQESQHMRCIIARLEAWS